MKDRLLYEKEPKPEKAQRVLVFATKAVLRDEDYLKLWRKLALETYQGVVLLPPYVECLGLATDVADIEIIPAVNSSEN